VGVGQTTHYSCLKREDVKKTVHTERVHLGESMENRQKNNHRSLKENLSRQSNVPSTRKKKLEKVTKLNHSNSCGGGQENQKVNESNEDCLAAGVPTETVSGQSKKKHPRGRLSPANRRKTKGPRNMLVTKGQGPVGFAKGKKKRGQTCSERRKNREWG